LHIHAAHGHNIGATKILSVTIVVVFHAADTANLTVYRADTEVDGGAVLGGTDRPASHPLNLRVISVGGYGDGGY